MYKSANIVIQLTSIVLDDEKTVVPCLEAGLQAHPPSLSLPKTGHSTK